MPRFNAARFATTSALAARRPPLITTPIFYVNASPHIGHLHSALLCDVLARWRRMKGERVVFSTGTDEHGSKVLSAAAAQSEAVEEFCERVSATYRDTFDAYDISYDRFIRTTEERHKSTVLRFWERLARSGYVYEGTHSGWYCKSDEAFLSESEIAFADEDGDNAADDAPRVSIESGHPVEWLDESNFKFKLGDRALQERVIAWLSSADVPLAPPSKLNEALAMLRQTSGADGSGIPDVAISRPASRVEWGITVPPRSSESSDAKKGEHTVYVWLDALLNYLTVAEESAAASTSDAGVGGATHVIGKDILKFHSIYWPAFLLAAGMEPPRHLFVHGHWTVGRVKMSKSLGNVVDPNVLLRAYGSEAVRYYLLAEGGNARGNDAHFSELELSEHLNADLADCLGNLAARCTAVTLTQALGDAADLKEEGCVHLAPPSIELLTAEDTAFIALMRERSAEVPSSYESLAVSDALGSVFEILREANRYFTANEPWKLKTAEVGADAESDAARRARLRAILYLSVESVRLSAALLTPVMPRTSTTLFDHVLGGADVVEASPELRTDLEAAKSVPDGDALEADDAPEACCFQMETTFTLAPRKLKLFDKVELK
jgi:methionyl-tRNA synthetase